MSNNNTSFIKMPSHQVKQLAEKCLVDVKNFRERDIKEINDDFFNEKAKWDNSSWWDRLWNDIENIGYRRNTRIQFVSIRYTANEKVAERLLNACRYADEIYVSIDDLNCL